MCSVALSTTAPDLTEARSLASHVYWGELVPEGMLRPGE